MKEKHDSIDLLKFVLSLCVIAIHVPPIRGGYEVLRLICRLAVPLFFIISSFLLFAKLDGITEKEEKHHILKTFVKRLLILYLSWTFILLPFTIIMKRWYEHGLFQTIITVIKQIIIGSGFIASWYLMALIIGTILIYAISNRLGNKVTFVISLCIFIICCLWCGYGKLLHFEVVDEGIKIYNSFPVSLAWIIVGKIIAENTNHIRSIVSGRRKYNLLLISFILYALEYFLCIRNDWANATDALLFQMPVCTMLFITVLSWNVNLGSKAITLRKISTVTYCLHASFANALSFVVRRMSSIDFQNTYECLVRYMITALVCVGVTFLIMKLSKRWKPFAYLY